MHNYRQELVSPCNSQLEHTKRMQPSNTYVITVFSEWNNVYRYGTCNIQSSNANQSTLK
jgi:hypothetical protein